MIDNGGDGMNATATSDSETIAAVERRLNRLADRLTRVTDQQAGRTFEMGKWVLASLLAANAGPLLSLFNSGALSNGMRWPAACWLAGVVLALFTGLFAYLSNLFSTWYGHEHLGQIYKVLNYIDDDEADEELALRTEDDLNEDEWHSIVHWPMWTSAAVAVASLIAFLTGSVLAAVELAG
jgi:hypothetical protein